MLPKIYCLKKSRYRPRQVWHGQRVTSRMMCGTVIKAGDREETEAVPPVEDLCRMCFPGITQDYIDGITNSRVFSFARLQTNPNRLPLRTFKAHLTREPPVGTNSESIYSFCGLSLGYPGPAIETWIAQDIGKVPDTCFNCISTLERITNQHGR